MKASRRAGFTAAATAGRASATTRRCASIGASAPMARPIKLAAAQEVNRMVAAVINADARGFCRGRMFEGRASCAATCDARGKAVVSIKWAEDWGKAPS
jgi:hypothetical protein